MKKAFFLIGIFIYTTVSSQTIEGSWKGLISAMGKSLPIVFHFEKQSDTSYKASFDSPDQNVFNMAAGTAIIIGDSLLLDMPVIHGGYYGRLSGDSISGTWKQGPALLPLVLHHGDQKQPQPLKRLQTPVPPYPYSSEDVLYQNADKTISYGATLTFPTGGKHLPAVILISGSGQQNRDCDIAGHKWFLVLADHLTRNGFAVLRVDDRGIGQTTGEVLNATSADFAKDVEVGIAWLKTRKEIDPKKIILVGHSEGGMIAPMVAARNKDVAAIIMLAGPAIGGAKTNEEQNVSLLEKSGLPDSVIRSFRLLHRNLQQAVIHAKTDLEFEKLVRAAYIKTNKKADDEAIRTLVVQYNELRIPWFKFFMSYLPANDIAKLKIPVLALNGSKDTQVDAAMNLPVIKKALLNNKSPFTTTSSLEGLNHLFQKCTTGETSEYKTIEETINPIVLKTISDWLLGVTK